MTVNEARTILRVRSSDSPKDIRRKYLVLMKECHPDNNRQARIDARLLNEAYQIISHTEEDLPSEKAVPWDAALAYDALCERTTYIQYTFSDGETHPIPIARGKYLWNPDAEDFSMLMKSVYEAARELKDRDDPVIFHYLMQEFVDPMYALEKMEKPWVFKCRTAIKDGAVVAAKSKLYAVSASGERTDIFFHDKSLLYVITPLIQVGAAAGEIREGRLQLGLTGKPFSRDYAGANEIIRKQIKDG